MVRDNIYEKIQNGVIDLKKRGFTLVELIIVMAIIGILAGIIIPVYGNYRTKAASAACNFSRSTEIRCMEGLLVLSGDRSEASVRDAFAEAGRNACPSGGEYSLEFDDDGYHIECSEHPFDEALLNASKKAVEKLYGGEQIHRRLLQHRLHLRRRRRHPPAFIEAELGAKLDTAWKVVRSKDGRKDVFEYYIADTVKNDDLRINWWTAVTKIDSAGNTVHGYVKAKWATEGHYKIFDDSSFTTELPDDRVYG